MKTRHLAVHVAAAMALAACAASAPQDASYSATRAKATAVLNPTKDSPVRGTATFSDEGKTMMVNVRVTGLKPFAEHGFHIHEKGDCSSPDGMSAGGHYNPAGKAHGNSNGGADHHAGDMPNLKADESGNANATFPVSGVSIGGANDIVGKGLIVHRDPDDYKSQPAGNAGPRVACGVIGRA
jgi:Cu-Zn family superoxide dismutase